MTDVALHVRPSYLRFEHSSQSADHPGPSLSFVLSGHFHAVAASHEVKWTNVRLKHLYLTQLIDDVSRVWSTSAYGTCLQSENKQSMWKNKRNPPNSCVWAWNRTKFLSVLISFNPFPSLLGNHAYLASLLYGISLPAGSTKERSKATPSAQHFDLSPSHLIRLTLQDGSLFASCGCWQFNLSCGGTDNVHDPVVCSELGCCCRPLSSQCIDRVLRIPGIHGNSRNRKLPF